MKTYAIEKIHGPHLFELSTVEADTRQDAVAKFCDVGYADIAFVGRYAVVGGEA
jgi:hypothetical protein